MITLKPGDLFRRIKTYTSNRILPAEDYGKPITELSRYDYLDKEEVVITPEDILVCVRCHVMYHGEDEYCDVVFLHPSHGVCFMYGAFRSLLELVPHDAP